MSSYTAILLGSLSTEQIWPSIIRLHRDLPLMKLFRTSNKDIINEWCVYVDFKLPSKYCM